MKNTASIKMSSPSNAFSAWHTLAQRIKAWGLELGFQQVGITDTHLGDAIEKLDIWLAKNYHGTMAYMAKHRDKRADPEKLWPGTKRIISVRMDYLPPNPDFKAVMQQQDLGNISRYAQGKDYHKLIRKRLNQLAERIRQALADPDQLNANPSEHQALRHALETLNPRPFVDSAPVMEKPLARKAGLGWIGKNTNLINPKAGSWFFLGSLFTNLPLPIDQPFEKTHCGSCQACLDICPTKAIVAPFQVDARACVSYLTIENKGSIPEQYRKAMGNRIYGCDDCQLICPWNKFAKTTTEIGFMGDGSRRKPRLVDLFNLTEAAFLKLSEGSAIRRIGYIRWLRNVAVALGNAPTSDEVIHSLKARENHENALVREHVTWALAQHFPA